MQSCCRPQLAVCALHLELWKQTLHLNFNKKTPILQAGLLDLQQAWHSAPKVLISFTTNVTPAVCHHDIQTSQGFKLS